MFIVKERIATVMNNQPLVSVCIPSYNSEKFIQETLESVLNQTYKNIEVVITDDCSNDNTVAIIQTFNDKRLKLFQNEKNLGVAENWNKALHLAIGKYCKLMGADDILFPTFLEDQVNVLENIHNFDIVLVTSNKNVIDHNGNKILSKKFPGQGKFSGIQALKKSIHRGTNAIGEPVAGLFRKELLKKSGFYHGDNLYMIDLDLWSRILKHGNLFVIGKVLYGFRTSKHSLSRNIGFAQVKLFNTFVDKLSVDEHYQINYFDKVVAKTMSVVMGFARNIIYLIYFRKNK